jgi:hypothetical protein
MTWGEFKTSIKDRLSVDKNRQGMSEFVDKAILDGVDEVIRLADGLSTLITEDYSLAGTAGFRAVSNEGNVSIGQTLADNELENAWVISRGKDKQVTVDPGDGDPNRVPLVSYPWIHAQDLKHGNPAISDRSALISVSPLGAFYVYPKIRDHEFIRMTYFKKTQSLADGDAVTFPEAMAKVIALFVKAKILREVDHDIRMHDSFLGEFYAERATFVRQQAKKGKVDPTMRQHRMLTKRKPDIIPVNE